MTALPCKVRDPDRKGKIESAVGHTQKTPPKGKRFESLEEAQAYLDRSEEHWADTRIHGRTKRQVAAMFAEGKPSLQVLPLEPFRYYQYGKRTVHIDGCVDSSIERIPAEDVDNLLRVAHADSLGPDGQSTNLEYLQAFETLDFLEHGVKDRMKVLKSDKEKRVFDRLARRVFAERKCNWDTRHASELLTLLAAPQNVGFVFRIREGIHRIFCPIE